MFVIYRTATSLQQTNYLTPRTIWYPALDEPNRMNSAYFTIHRGKKSSSPKWLPVENRCFFKIAGFVSSTFPIQPDFSQNQLAAITLINTGSPRTLITIHLNPNPNPLAKTYCNQCHSNHHGPNLLRLLRFDWGSTWVTGWQYPRGMSNNFITTGSGEMGIRKLLRWFGGFGMSRIEETVRLEG